MKVYVAGPMRGIAAFNFPAFADAAARLRAAGYEVTSPHEHDLNNGFDPSGMAGDVSELGPSGFNLAEALTWDLTYVLNEADAVVRLDGWTESDGATAETFAAKAVGKPVLTLAEALEYAEPFTDGHGRHVSAAAYERAVSENEDPPRVVSLKRAIGYVSGDRNASYGPPTQDFRRTADLWTAFGFRFVQHDGAEPVAIKSHQIALAMILLKTSRSAWQPEKADNWDDTSGYSGCGHECVVAEAAEAQQPAGYNVADLEAAVAYVASRYGTQETSNHDREVA